MRAVLALLFVACATAAPTPAPAPAPQPEPARPTERELVTDKLTGIETLAAKAEVARDDALWTFWLGGAPSTEEVWPPALLDDATLATLRRARELKLSEPAALDRLEALIAGERVGRDMREVEATVANLEASLRFPFEGRDVSYRDLGSLLVNEKSPTRRQSLWAASLAAVKQLDAALAKRDEVQRSALAATGHTPETFAALVRDGDPAAAVTWADGFLTATELRWKGRITALRARSRGDLPAVLRPSAGLDAAFPKPRIAERGTGLLAALGLYGLSQLTLDLTDTPRKQPLPLTVSGVRTSFKPRGGFKDQQSLLAELGRALALRHSPRAARRTVEASAALFGSLAWNRAWLDEQGVTGTVAAEALAAGSDALLLSLRRAAGGVLATAGREGALDRAYMLTDDAARTRLDVEPLYAGADTLAAASAAFALGRHLEVQCGAKWWSSPKASEVLRGFWQTSELPEPVRGFGASGESLLAALGAPAHGGVTPSSGTSAGPPGP